MVAPYECLPSECHVWWITAAHVSSVLDWLSPLNMYQKQQDMLSQRHGSTRSWLLSKPTFQQWVKSEGSRRTLWCPGHRKCSLVLLKEACLPPEAGTGKTVMTYVEMFGQSPLQQLSADWNMIRWFVHSFHCSAWALLWSSRSFHLFSSRDKICTLALNSCRCE